MGTMLESILAMDRLYMPARQKPELKSVAIRTEHRSVQEDTGNKKDIAEAISFLHLLNDVI